MKRILLILVGLSSLVLADFSKNKGIVTDNTTGLQWQDDYQESDTGKDVHEATWQSAIEYCEILDLGEKSDWRLPNKNELLSIVDYSAYNYSIDEIFEHTSNYYWSSTTSINNTESACIVYFDEGGINKVNKDTNLYVRCVRSGQ